MAIVAKSGFAGACAALIAAVGLVAPAAGQQPPATGATRPQAGAAQSGSALGAQMMQGGMERSRMSQGTAGSGMMDSGAMSMMMGPGHVEGRLAFIKAELKIIDAQMPQWNVFADAVRANAAAVTDMYRSMKFRQPSGTNLPERLANEEVAVSAHLAALKKIREAVNNLYGVLSPEQRKIADGIVIGGMGMPIGMM
jgi:hypothetical protein